MPTLERFKLHEAASYDAVARRFAELSSRYSAPLAERLVQIAGLGPTDHVLDVGTGAGLVARHAARKLVPGGSVLGIDLSDGMISIARHLAETDDLAVRAEFEPMDAEALTLSDATCDVVLSLFALAHLPNPRVALGEMWRVLRPKGRTVIGIGGGPPWCSWEGARARLRHISRAWSAWRGICLIAPALLDRLVARRLPRMETDRETAWARRSGLRAHAVVRWMRQAGFAKVQSAWVGYEAVIESVEEFWDVQATFSTFARKRLALATAADIRGIRDELERLARQVAARGGRFVYPFGATLICGVRP